MSSMWRIAFLLPLTFAAWTTSSAQAPRPVAAARAPAAPAVGYALNDWRTLRQSSGYPFATYASFIIAKTGRDALFFQGKGIFQLPVATMMLALTSVTNAIEARA